MQMPHIQHAHTQTRRAPKCAIKSSKAEGKKQTGGTNQAVWGSASLKMCHYPDKGVQKGAAVAQGDKEVRGPGGAEDL